VDLGKVWAPLAPLQAGSFASQIGGNFWDLNKRAGGRAAKLAGCIKYQSLLQLINGNKKYCKYVATRKKNKGINHGGQKIAERPSSSSEVKLVKKNK